MNNQEPTPVREATLREYVSVLPVNHAARTEYDDLIDSLCDETAERVDLSIDLERAIAKRKKWFAIAILSTMCFVVTLISWMIS